MKKHLGVTLAVFGLAIMAVGIGLASCGGGSNAPTCVKGSGAGKCTAGQMCSASADCIAGLSCPDGTCKEVFVCTADTQCVAGSNAGVPATCTAGKCICLDGSCQERGCSTDAVCQGGQICVAGKCTTKPAATGLSCSILTPSQVVRQGQTVTFVAVAKNANQAIVPGQTFSWKSSVTGVAAIDASGVATGGATTGTTNITCQVVGGATTDSAPVVLQNYAGVTAGQVRVVVTDSRSGTPLAGAIVVIEKGGVAVGSAITTGVDGVAEATTTPPVSVHVFKTGYTYTSIIEVDGADLLVPVLQTPDTTKAGGFKGTFDVSAVSNKDDTVEFGLAGASLGGSFIDLDFTKLIGESIKTRVTIGSLYDDDANLPSGLYLKLGDQAIKGDFQALGEPGVAHLWALGGKVPFDKLIQILTPLLGGGTTDIPFGEIISGVIPFFDKFRHFTRADFAINEAPKVVDTNDINGNMSTTDLVPDFGNATAFPTVNAVVTQSLSLSTSVAIPTLPTYGGNFLEGAVVLTGANAIGRGLVPLGLSAAVDAPGQGETPDGVVDSDPATPGAQSTLAFKMAPLHSGLEGSKYFVAALAISLNLTTAGNQVSGILTQSDSIAATTTLGASAFLGFPEAASFNLGNRQFNLGTAVTGATIHRADFDGADGGWVVYFKPGATFTLPGVPTGIPQDRAVVNNKTNLRVFSLSTSGATLDQLVGFGGTNLNGLNDVVKAFSNTQCQDTGSCAAPTP